MDWIKEIAAYILIPLGSAFIGTWWGARKLIKLKDDEKNKVRAIAIKAIDIFLKYAKNDNNYSITASDFNNSMSISEKRAVLVALDKLGIPINVPVEGPFSISSVSFLDKSIDKENLTEIKFQIANGYVDSLFFIDPEKYFNEDLKIKTLRNLAKRYVNEVMRYSHLNDDRQSVHFDIDYYNVFTFFEANSILVFRLKTLTDTYYYDNKNINIEKLNLLILDIDRGLCDMYLNTDFTAYNNMVSQSILTNVQLESIKNTHNNEIKSIDKSNNTKTFTKGDNHN